ncbi:MAG: S41 family peptidase [Chloroflexota bacterium]|nr:S41 family peptidase [Chloroflexota bacterium]
MQPSSYQSNRSTRRSILLGTLIGAGLAAVFFAGFFAHDLIDAPGSSAADVENYALLREVQGILDSHYLREQPDATLRQHAAVRAVLATLNDRYTFFIDPPVAASESDVLAGTYGGIGVQISRSSTGEFILFPFADSPAMQAGIQNGDLLEAVNGQPISVSQSQDAVDQLMRGEVAPGLGVEVTVRQADGTSFTRFIAFGIINVPSVIWRVLAEDSSLGYVHILRFTARTPDEVSEALTALRADGIRALVLDLRGNTGGLLQESIDVADEFLDSGLIVRQSEPTQQTDFTAQPGGASLDLPMVLLVNEMTASGAELVAGALRDRDRAILIGRKTYGKGTVQRIFALSDRSSLHVTSAEWFTPSERPLDAIGIEPDILVELPTDGRDLDLAAAIVYLQSAPQTACMICDESEST